MYKTKIGLKLMDHWGEKYREQVKFLSLMGIGIGFIGMFTIFFMLLKNLFELLTVPKAVSAVSLVIPGVKIPGSPIHIPLITGWIALFLVILVHEFSHGVVARAHKIKVASSGIFFLGPLMGAFVEPAEKNLRKSNDITQHSVYAAGPWSNIILALVCIFLLTYIFAPLNGAMVNEVGVELAGVAEGLPAEAAGLGADMLITQVNGVDTLNHDQFTIAIRHLRPNESVTMLVDDKEVTFKAGAHPQDAQQGYLGVLVKTKPKVETKNPAMWYKVLYRIFLWIAELFSITGILSFGIGLANLLPLGPVDGGRMVLTAISRIKGEKKGMAWWKKISLFTLLLLAINVFWPAIKWIGTLLMTLVALI
ncbi:site-2 protease family protein [Nanoarchaeota archaeon]